MTTDPVQDILARLQGVKPTGQNQWEACCPAHTDRRASLCVGRGKDGRVLVCCQAGCSTFEIRSAMALPWSAFFPPGSSPTSGGPSRIVATYDYRNAAGTVLFQVVRFDPKDFRQRKPDGNDGWVWELGDTPRVLYRLPEVIQSLSNHWNRLPESTPSQGSEPQSSTPIKAGS